MKNEGNITTMKRLNEAYNQKKYTIQPKYRSLTERAKDDFVLDEKEISGAIILVVGFIAFVAILMIFFL